MEHELKQIKKLYGEDMMHFVRKCFPTILTEKGKLLNLLRENFNERKDLYNDLVQNKLLKDFEYYIDYLSSPDRQDWVDSIEKPYDLLKKCGYTLYECKNKKELNRFREYYEEDEMLCSFYDPDRLDERYVFFIVKDYAKKLNRNKFIRPNINDDYSKSVLSIQFEKGKYNKPFIISRYNHEIRNPDSVCDNNLDKICPGLSYSFIKEYNFNFLSPIEKFNIPGYQKDPKTNKFYKTNIITDKYSFCPNNIILTKEGVIDYFSKENNASYILMDGYLLDLINKKFINFYDDSFTKDFDNIKDIKVSVDKESSNRLIEIDMDGKIPVYILINYNNQIIKYINNNITTIKRNFMVYNTELSYLICNNVKRIEGNMLVNNLKLKEFDFPNTIFIGNNILLRNKLLTEVFIPEVLSIGDNFCSLNRNAICLVANEVRLIGKNFLHYNVKLDDIFLPKAIYIGDNFLEFNSKIKIFFANKLIKCGNNVLSSSNHLDCVKLDSLYDYGEDFLLEADDMLKEVKKNVRVRKIKNTLNIDKNK